MANDPTEGDTAQAPPETAPQVVEAPALAPTEPERPSGGMMPVPSPIERRSLLQRLLHR